MLILVERHDFLSEFFVFTGSSKDPLNKELPYLLRWQLLVLDLRLLLSSESFGVPVFTDCTRQEQEET